ncbi:MAG: exo-beta-N-acetylmuramidase NamZ domain-containing protein [Gemmatimonadales bacterium]
MFAPSVALCLMSGTWAACGAGDAPARDAAAAPAPAVRPGIEVLLSDSLHLVAGRRVGLVTNHTGVDREGRSDIDLLAEHPAVQLVALYAPEHGIRGDQREGATIASDVDERTGVPIHSLYGATLAPTPEMLEGVDVLLFDMQDIGARYYTYVSTMALAMRAAGENGIPFIVLDRPNPIRGDVVQGNVLDPEFATFVGMFPVPMRHGMTPGELARLYAGEFGIEVQLAVVPVDGWTRASTFADTGLPWIAPSPNMPTLESALAYPGTCLFEGTPLSVGRGTERAFQWVGAPWLDGTALAAALEAYAIPGVRFEAATFTPTGPSDGKFDRVEVHGVRLVATTSDYDAPRAAVAMLVEARRASGDRWSWATAHFDRLAGTDELRAGIERGLDVAALVETWDAQQAGFETLRDPYLIYR